MGGRMVEYENKYGGKAGKAWIKTSKKKSKKSYDTFLTKEELKKFKKWVPEHEKMKDDRRREETGEDYKHNLMEDKKAYDVQGFWKAMNNAKTEEERNMLLNPEDLHGTDQFKKPNHPTFSEHSMYHGVEGKKGGTWGRKDGRDVFYPTQHNIDNMGGVDKYKEWFKNYNSGADLAVPSVYKQGYRGNSDTYIPGGY